MRTGILTQAQRAKEETEKAQVTEENVLTNYEQIINSATGVTLETITGFETSNTVTQDSLGNRIIVPAGFKVVIPEGVSLENYNVENGIVIEDVSHKETKGSQFVWIPVGTGIKKKDGTTFDIKLSRYIFDTNAIPTDQGTNTIYDYHKELSISTYGNITAKEGIESEYEGFRKSAIKNGGYYIGRYEARTSNSTQRTTSTNDNGLTQITVKPDEYVYNWVTQPQAAKLSQEMYTDNNFESDLMNSYAWDTALIYIQASSENIKYSRQTRVTSTFAPKGTNNLDVQDVECNIFDMAGNCYEWTTETSSYTDGHAVRRGSVYDFSEGYASVRSSGKISSNYTGSSFRPILYL